MSKEQSEDHFFRILNKSSIHLPKRADENDVPSGESILISKQQFRFSFEAMSKCIGASLETFQNRDAYQMQNPPPMGTQVDITLTGVRGIGHDDDAFELTGEVRHHLAWNYHSKGIKKAVTAVGVRFCRRVNPFNPDRGWIH